MKKFMATVVIGCLFLITTLAQAQVDKMIDRFLPRGESGIRPEDLRIAQLEFSPDPVREGQRISFHITIVNDSRNSGIITLAVKDRDEVVTAVRDVRINPGENRIDFPETNYRLSRSDTCFTVEAAIDHTRRVVELTKEFCARRTSSGWTLADQGVSLLYVEDLAMNPDPVTPGQDIRFKVRLRNDGRPMRGDIRIQDKDRVVAQVENVSFPRGTSDFQFPYTTRYTFQRLDHCFTVVVDFERTPYPVDAAREFCAKPMGWTLRP
jgi:hypothetical protein